jgi:hypothetical protein
MLAVSALPASFHYITPKKERLYNWVYVLLLLLLLLA